jgi:DNA-binding XRE family transcriptional regulator
MDMDFADRLAVRLRARRAQLGLTLLTVATEAGLSVPYIANLEKARGNPTLDVIVALARALDVSPAELIGDAWSTTPEDGPSTTSPPTWRRCRTCRPRTCGQLCSGQWPSPPDHVIGPSPGWTAGDCSTPSRSSSPTLGSQPDGGGGPAVPAVKARSAGSGASGALPGRTFDVAFERLELLIPLRL